jgi:hypothetical protein
MNALSCFVKRIFVSGLDFYLYNTDPIAQWMRKALFIRLNKNNKPFQSYFLFI